jgi:hypothetical protein
VNTESKTAQFVCRFYKSEAARKAHELHAQLGEREFRFTKEWTLSLGHETLYDPGLVAMQCPLCNLAWTVDFEKFIE